MDRRYGLLQMHGSGPLAITCAQAQVILNWHRRPSEVRTREKLFMARARVDAALQPFLPVTAIESDYSGKRTASCTRRCNSRPLEDYRRRVHRPSCHIGGTFGRDKLARGGGSGEGRIGRPRRRRAQARGLLASVPEGQPAMSQKRGSSGWPGRLGFRHGSVLLPPTSLPAADHPARDLALSPVHTELPGRGGATGG
jgi:hypothetical protein